MKVSKLEYKKIIGAGCQIHAHIDGDIPCVEFTMNGKMSQPILIGYEPWIQFPPKEWKDMIAKVFEEMVDAWNEKYNKNNDKL